MATKVELILHCEKFQPLTSFANTKLATKCKKNVQYGEIVKKITPKSHEGKYLLNALEKMQNLDWLHIHSITILGIIVRLVGNDSVQASGRIGREDPEIGESRRRGECGC